MEAVSLDWKKSITAEVGNRREGRVAKEGEWDKASYCTIIAVYTVTYQQF